MLKKFLHHVLPRVIKPLRIVWNQAIGFLFLVLAVLSARPIYRSYMEANVVRLLISGIFGALMTWFGISSFWRAWRISRS
jgi:hypothetical protein